MKVQVLTEKLLTTKYQFNDYVDKYSITDQRVKMNNLIQSISDYDTEKLIHHLINSVNSQYRRNLQQEVDSLQDPGSREQIAKELFSKFKSKIKSDLKEYRPLDSNDIIQIIDRSLRRDKDEIKGKVFTKFVAENGKEKVSQLAVDGGYIRDSYYDEDNPWKVSQDIVEIIDKTYVRPEDIGKSRFSDVHSSSFSTYYYYQVEATVCGQPWQGLITLSDYYSGGWD